MADFTFFKHDGSKKPPILEMGEFRNELEARLHAMRLLKDGPAYRSVEVWDGAGETFIVQRPQGLQGRHLAN